MSFAFGWNSMGNADFVALLDRMKPTMSGSGAFEVRDSVFSGMNVSLSRMAVRSHVHAMLDEGVIDMDRAFVLMVDTGLVNDDPISRMRWIAEQGDRS